jgi:Multicopper oxidase
VFFKAPLDGAGKVYTIFAQEVVQHSDNYQQRIQQSITRDTDRGNPSPIDVVIGYVHVRGDAVEGGDFDVMSLVDVLPPVPPFLQPVSDDELRIPTAEARRRGVRAGDFRTRVVGYSGHGGQDFPLIEVPESFAKAHPELERRVWASHGGVKVLLAPAARTMATNTHFDLAVHPEPAPPRKFAHHDPEGEIRVLVDTAEEWVLYNNSIPLWGHVDRAKDPQPGQFNAHRKGYAMTRAEGQRRFATHPDFQIVAKGVDHPFHIHVNPCWVTRIEVPDEHGHLHNVLEEPCWMDTLWIPRGGRAVFRTRFADHVGRWVHHCHILLHEDHGMMQTVDCGTRAERATYNPKPKVATHGMPEAEVNAIYPRPSLDVMYRQSLTFIDPTPELGQTYPGFDVSLPTFGLS